MKYPRLDGKTIRLVEKAFKTLGVNSTGEKEIMLLEAVAAACEYPGGPMEDIYALMGHMYAVTARTAADRIRFAVATACKNPGERLEGLLMIKARKKPVSASCFIRSVAEFTRRYIDTTPIG